MSTPNSYKDPYWINIAKQSEDKVGLPSGLLQSILLNGEKTNADQVSSAKARTPFQIIPSTRQGAIDKYGVDPYLSAENAGFVAASLLKDSLDRNNGDIHNAIAEYHGGTNRANWGKVNRAYVQRVAGGFEERRIDELSNGLSAWLSANPAQSADMQPAQNPVSSGTFQGENDPLDQGFKQWMNAQPQPGHALSEQIPGYQPPTQQIDPTLSDRIIGGLEGAATTASGMTTGILGLAAGTAKGIYDSVQNGTFGTQEGVNQAENTANQYASAATYTPRTEVGQQVVNKISDDAQNLVALTPMAGELAALHGVLPNPTVSEIIAGAKPAVARAAEAIKNPLNAAADFARENNPFNGGGRSGLGGATPGSAGAAATEQANIVRANLNDLPVPIDNPTTGVLYRNPDQQRFEWEQAKTEGGQDLRNRFEDYSQKIHMNLEKMADDTGSIATGLRDVGLSVDNALVKDYERKTKKIETAFNMADRRGELRDPVNMQPLADFLNQSYPSDGIANILPAVRQELLRLGGAVEGAASQPNTIAGAELSLKDAELLRQYIVQNTDGTNPQNIRFATILKKTIDGITEDAGGDVYKKARKMREKLYNEYENRVLINDLMSNKKGNIDRKVALENVFNRSILDSSVDEITHLKNLLNQTRDGRTAWTDLQGQLFKYIQEQATSKLVRDSQRRDMITAAGLNGVISKLDKGGKLDLLVGKKTAGQLRLVNDAVKDLLVPLPGVVNTSNSGTIVLEAFKQAMGAGFAAPLKIPAIMGLLTKQTIKYAKERNTRKRINDALAGKPLPKLKGKK